MKLEDVKAGDKVIKNGNNWNLERVVIVDRVTKTQVITDGSRYRKDDGGLVGGGYWGCNRISAASDEDIIRVELEFKKLNVTRKLQKRTFSSVPLEQLIEIEAIASKFDKGEQQ